MYANSKLNLRDVCSYVLAHYKVKTFSEIREPLGISSRALRGVFKRLNITALSFDEAEIIRRALAVEAGEMPAPLPPSRVVVSALDFLPPPPDELPEKKRSKYQRANESPVVPDPPKPKLVRPAAVYTNTSPYGIAADYLLNPGKYEKPESDSVQECDADPVVKYGGKVVSKKTFAGKMNSN